MSQLRRSARKRKNLPIVAAASARKKANQRVPDTMSVTAPQLPTVDTGTPFITVTSSTGTYPMLFSQTGAGIYTSASTGPVDLTSTANTLLYSRVPLPDQRVCITVTSQDPPEHSLETAVLSELENTQTDENTITKQEINYLRVVHLVASLAVPTVRHVFDTEFDPGKLTNTMRKNSKKLQKLWQKKRITKTQFDLLIKEDSLTSEKLNLQLMICLLRNIGPKFDIKDELPLPTAVTVEANLSRIKYYRNIVSINHNHGTLSEDQFTKVWGGLCEAITGLNKKAFVKYSSAYEDNVDPTDASSKALTEAMQNETSHSKWRVRSMTNEEHYYLRIIHVWHSVVFRAVRVKFDSIFPSSHPYKILKLSSKDFRNILQDNKRDKRCALIGLDALCQEKDKKSSINFTLTLMIELLLVPRNYDKINKKEYTALSELLLLSRKIDQSDNTIFTRETFDAYWKTITTSVIDLVGEAHQRIFERKLCYFDPEKNNPLEFISQTSNIPCAVTCEI